MLYCRVPGVKDNRVLFTVRDCLLCRQSLSCWTSTLLSTLIFPIAFFPVLPSPVPQSPQTPLLTLEQIIKEPKFLQKPASNKFLISYWQITEATLRLPFRGMLVVPWVFSFLTRTWDCFLSCTVTTGLPSAGVS